MYVEFPLRQLCTPTTSQALGDNSLAQEGAMDVNLWLTTTLKPLPSTNKVATIPPPGPLSANHVQWIMAAITWLEAKIDHFKEDIKCEVVTDMIQQ